MLLGECLVVLTGVLWQEKNKNKIIVLQGKVLKDFYQLPADKAVEHVSICLLVLQLCQDQQNHSKGWTCFAPAAFSSRLVFCEFLPLSFVISAVTVPAGSRHKVHAE